MIRVIFCRRRNLGSLLLRTILWSQWSHCAIIDGDDVIEASFPHGVRRRPLQELIDEATHYEIVPFITEVPETVLAMARLQLGKPYDWRGVIGIEARRKWQDDDAWFCSELIAGAFALAGQPRFRAHAWRITPRDLYLPL